ncbi:MAG: GGDEF domain-containing protein [Lachnospiraceae bacterium]|nr:GGDEF domain-containing protein [Lachnospiraceae bacterium]
MKRYYVKFIERGISVRFSYAIMSVLIALLVSGLIYMINEASVLYNDLSVATDDYIVLTRAAKDLMDASDYLTQEVQLFTVSKDTEHMDKYFNEANTVKRREEAIKAMGIKAGDTEAFRQLQSAYNASIKLMEREYYAMKLVLVACNISEYPEELRDVMLSDYDKGLSGEQKIETAQELVHDKYYYKEKTIIRNRMSECTENLETETHTVQIESAEEMRRVLFRIEWAVIVLMLAFVVVFLLTLLLIIRPLHRAVKRIETDKPLNVEGGSEFKSLARTYNKMYELQKKNFAELSYEATHDALTGLYNRAGYEYIKSSIVLKTTAMILIDCDRFKSINDTMGHETGDKILVKLADALRAEFREDDYVCRIGGDEFLIFMTNTDKKSRNLIRDKIKNINRRLQDTSDGLPDSSISAGVVFGAREKNLDVMFRHADITLYRMKEQRNGCAFYTE